LYDHEILYIVNDCRNVETKVVCCENVSEEANRESEIRMDDALPRLCTTISSHIRAFGVFILDFIHTITNYLLTYGLTLSNNLSNNRTR
jgi:hypothetical protein